MRTCRTCGDAKPLDEFDVRADTGKHRSVCKACRRERQRRPAPSAPRADGSGGREEKRCTRCGEVKLLAEFPLVRRDGQKRQSWCRSCFAMVNAANYARNREREKARLVAQTAKRRAETRENMIEYLLVHPCVDCGEKDIVVLEFDHRGSKVDNISTYANGRTWATVLQEIEKCDVRCANCHRRATARRGRSKIRKGRGPARQIIQLELASVGLYRVCRVCGAEKPLSEFPIRSARTGVRHHVCLVCQRDIAARRYATAVGRPVRAQRRRGTALHATLAAGVFAYLIEHPCIACGEADPIVLDFDHRGDKIANVATLVRDGAPWELVAAEIAKCDVRCANCHRRRTMEVVGGYRRGA